ncbi:replicative DNA helicase [Fodinicurvata sp. EGI_FJ10296]|uniref:replicative DNA helicase n=1 Tax=Fodinicurvata sp. EGI_FJ10296 TaxID=3231908 RepID=UPI00345175DD
MNRPPGPDAGRAAGNGQEASVSMPSNEAAEKALLGAILFDNELIDRVADFLKPDHFFWPIHGRIYSACSTLRQSLRVADEVTLQQYFEADGELETIGGIGYIAELSAAVVSPRSAEDYAKTIYDLNVRRQLIRIGQETTDEALDYDPDLDTPDLIRSAEEKLYVLANEGDFRKEFESFSTIIDRTIQSASEALNRDTALTGCTTGLVDLDRMLGGLQRSDLLILAGRPGMGKTALATNIAFNAARAHARNEGREGAVCAVFSLEMSSEQLGTRILSDAAEISSEKIRKGEIARKDFPRLVEAAQDIRSTPLFVDDTAGLTISMLRTRAMRLKRQHDLGMIVVDYVQLMRGATTNGRNAENRVQEISEITRGLKMIAKDLDVPVVALSQLSRAVEQREDKRPQLADLRESGSIEQDADVVLFVYRPAYYEEKKEPEAGTPEHADWQSRMERIHNIAQVIVAKQRHGPTGTVDLHFEGSYTRFSNLETRFDADGDL